MVLNDVDLLCLAEQGMVTPIPRPNHISCCSIDLTIGSQIQIESLDTENGPWVPVDITEPYLIKPKQRILAHTEEYICIPDGYSAQILLRSTAARMGWNHALAGWIDPSFQGQITLELTNDLQLHELQLEKGQRLIQMIVFKLSAPPARNYEATGNYQRQTGATISNNNV